jgi:glycosyltransferase involved in cell wall biosynthesis
MNIGILVDEIAPGSAPKIIGQSVKNLNSLGHHAEALAIVDKGYSKKYPQVYSYHLDDVRVRYFMSESKSLLAKIDFKFPGFSFFSFHHLTSGLLTASMIKDKEFDCIIAHNPYSAFVARSLLKKKKIPFFMLIWDPSPYTLTKVYSKTWMRYFFPILSFAARQLDKYAFKHCLAIITAGKLHHEYLKKITDRPLEVLPCGCFPLDKLPPFSQREKTILAFDRWDVGQKPNVFLDILQALKKKVKLIIGGFWHPVGLRDSFIKEVNKRDMQGQVEIIGPLDENKIIELCSRVMLHIHLNEESFGMQTLEAAGCGCPIMIPRGSGVTDLFEHGVHGYFPEKGDISEFIKYIEIIFNDLDKTKRMSYNAWNTAKKYTWRYYAETIERIAKKYCN